MSAPAYGDKHPRDDLYWNGFEWIAQDRLDRAAYDQEMARAEADASTQDAIAKSALIVTKGDGVPLPDQAAALAEFKRQCAKPEPKEGAQVKVLSIMGEQIEFPDEFNAHQMLSVVIEVLKERSSQVTARGSEQDRRWSPLDWKEMIDDYNAMARRAMTMGKRDEARRRYIQVAALALAAVEAFDTNRIEALREETAHAQPGGGRKFFGGEQQ